MFIPLIIIIALLEIYVFNGISTIAIGENSISVLAIYYSSVAVTFVGVLNFIQSFKKGVSSLKPRTNLLFGLAFSIIVFNLVFAIFLFAEDLYRTILFIGQSIFSNDNISFPARNTFWIYISLSISFLPFLAMIHGVIYGKYLYTIKTIKLKISNLPKSFQGFRLVQFSDAHLGSFDSLKGLQKGINTIKKAKPDVILFTGDMVNNLASEAQPYIEEFKSLQAPFGKFSILGNHDYGAYVRWPSQQAKENNLNTLKDIQAEMGFEMLHNRHVYLEKNGEKICIAGVENWGKPPFPQYGDLNKALDGVSDEMITVLLSHDPSHWDLQVKQYPKKVDLTLSGHTHGMQFGIDLPFFKWSPVKWKYPKWAGLYEEAGKYLYVNRGFGFLGFPGRAGIWPEITVIELVC